MSQQIFYISDKSQQTSLKDSLLKTSAFGQKITYLEVEEFMKLPKKDSSDTQIFVTNSLNVDLLHKTKENLENCHTILLTNIPLPNLYETITEENYTLIDHIIDVNTEFHSHDFRITIQKILQKNVQQIEKYLAPHSKILEQEVSLPLERSKLEKIMALAEKYKLPSSTAKSAYAISEELLMNALNDAPNSVAKPREAGHCLYRMGFDGKVLALSVKDYYGGLKKEQFYKYLGKVLYRHNTDILIDTKKEGAGLGLFKILYNSNTLICNVKDNEYTEVISLIILGSPVRDVNKSARSIHFFREAPSQ